MDLIYTTPLTILFKQDVININYTFLMFLPHLHVKCFFFNIAMLSFRV